MPPCPRAFALGCVLLVALHAGAAGPQGPDGTGMEGDEQDAPECERAGAGQHGYLDARDGR